MADFLIQGTTTSNTQIDLQPKDLCPNNYLTIVWKDVQTGNIVNTLDYNDKNAVEYTNKINASIDNAIRNQKISYVGQNKFINIEAIGKYLAQNIFPAGTQRTVVNALISLVSGSGKKTTDDIIDLCLNVFGDIADKTARKLGFTDPHEIFSQLSGQNVINVIGELANSTDNFLGSCVQKINNFLGTNLFSNFGDKENTAKYAGLLLGLTTSDTESYEITIPRRKVEEGSDYTTHLLPQPWKKEFNVKLTNKILSENFSQTIEIQNIENVKNKLIEIAQSRTLFDIYIRLSDDVMYKRSNVVFSSLSFSKDENSGNGYTATFTIEPINLFKTKVFVSDQKYKSKMRTSSAGTSSGSGSKSSGSASRTQASKSSKGNSFKYGHWKQTGIIETASSKQELYQKVRQLPGENYILFAPRLNPQYQVVSGSDVYAYIEKDRSTTYILNADVHPAIRTGDIQGNKKLPNTGTYTTSGHVVESGKGLRYIIEKP